MSQITGILLFAHGSRDSQWREPFSKIHKKVAIEHTGPVSLAFLEYMHPEFLEATSELISNGATEIRVVPLFLAAGGHVQSCIPDLVTKAQTQHPGVKFYILPPLGESHSVIEACSCFALSNPH